MNGTGIMICDDLIFFSRVAATARELGLNVVQARTTEKALELARKSLPGGVIVDLNNDGIDLPGLLAGLKDIEGPLPSTLGYGSHMEPSTLRAARMTGMTFVMPRSQFMEDLETKIETWLQPHRG